jgi:flagellar hook-length control protein FliK
MTRGARHTEAAETPQVDPSRFIGRVVKAFHTAQERGGTLQLRLSPPVLGAIRLQLTVTDGVLTAALETESADTRRLLLDHLPVLRDRLAEQNIRVERFDVDVQQEHRRDQANPRGSNQNPYQQQPEQSAPRRGSATPSRTVTATASEPIAPATPRIGAT